MKKSRDDTIVVCLFITLIYVLGIITGAVIKEGIYSIKEPEPKEIVKYVEVIATRTEPIEPTEKEPEFVSLGTFQTTAYCACYDCCKKHPTDPNYGKTASGTKATAGRTVAADITVLPFGTEIYINGHKYIVEDTGEAIKGDRLDIFFTDHNEALRYGRKTVEVFSMK